MDGTLCDVRSVRHFVEASTGDERFRRNFNAFHSAALECPAHPAVVALLDRLQGEGVEILVVSAREAKWGFQTAIWLDEHDIAYDDMFLRANGDNRPDSDVKREIASQLVQRFRPVVAIDDRDDIIDVWHAFGIPTVLVRRRPSSNSVPVWGTSQRLRPASPGSRHPLTQLVLAAPHSDCCARCGGRAGDHWLLSRLVVCCSQWLGLALSGP
jgi:beta-phosphoglucomutase-like phosphatase (HAD superfamily)